MYRVFTRTWWKRNPAWPHGREPQPGRKHTIARGVSFEEARAICQRYNATHDPGFLSRKAEFEEQ
jgi:hypothetical protein